MVALATLDELENALDWTLDAQEKSVATADLEIASNLVRQHGLNWTDLNVPPIAKSIVIQAARRHMVNIQGLTASRAGDEMLGWDGIGDKAGSVYLTEDEKSTLSTISHGRAFGSVSVFAWSPSPRRDRTGYVPVSSGGKDFPWYADDTEP